MALNINNAEIINISDSKETFFDDSYMPLFDNEHLLTSPKERIQLLKELNSKYTYNRVKTNNIGINNPLFGKLYDEDIEEVKHTVVRNRGAYQYLRVKPCVSSNTDCVSYEIQMTLCYDTNHNYDNNSVWWRLFCNASDSNYGPRVVISRYQLYCQARFTDGSENGDYVFPVEKGKIYNIKVKGTLENNVATVVCDYKEDSETEWKSKVVFTKETSAKFKWANEDIILCGHHNYSSDWFPGYIYLDDTVAKFTDIDGEEHFAVSEDILNGKSNYNPTLTSDSVNSNGCSCYASHESNPAWWAFDGDTTTSENCWWTAHGRATEDNPCWIVYKYDKPVTPKGMWIMNEIASPENMRDAYIQLSNNGSDWETVYTITNRPDSYEYTETYTFDNTEKYQYVRLFVFNGHGGGGVSIQEIKIITEEQFDAPLFTNNGCTIDNITSVYRTVTKHDFSIPFVIDSSSFSKGTKYLMEYKNLFAIKTEDNTLAIKFLFIENKNWKFINKAELIEGNNTFKLENSNGKLKFIVNTTEHMLIDSTLTEEQTYFSAGNSSNYIQTNIFDHQGKPWTIETYAKYSNSVSDYETVIDAQSRSLLIGYIDQSYRRNMGFYLSSNGSSWDIYGTSEFGRYLDLNKNYYYKLEFDGSSYKYYYKEESAQNYTLITSFNSSTKIYITNIIFKGSVYTKGCLSKTKIWLNGEIWFDGKTAVEGVDYTVVGSPTIETETVNVGGEIPELEAGSLGYRESWLLDTTNVPESLPEIPECTISD